MAHIIHLPMVKLTMAAWRLEAAISMVQPMLCTIVTQVSHEYATDFLQSKEDAEI